MTALSPDDAERLRQAFLQCSATAATLREQLATYAAAGREIFPAYADAVDRLVARLQANGGGENAPRPGEVMPPFVMPDDTGHLVDLTSLLASGPVAVMFFRGHWCPYCRLSAIALVRASHRIRESGGRLVAITPELQSFTQRFKAETGADFPVLTDLDNGYALSLNLAIWLGSEVRNLLAHQDFAAFHGNDGGLLPIPAVFVVSRDGLVTARFIDPDFRRRMEVDDLVAALAEAARA